MVKGGRQRYTCDQQKGNICNLDFTFISTSISIFIQILEHTTQLQIYVWSHMSPIMIFFNSFTIRVIQIFGQPDSAEAISSIDQTIIFDTNVPYALFRLIKYFWTRVT